MNRFGFIVNPIAGMGGRVGLKGTDQIVHQAIRLGAQPVSESRALITLTELKTKMAQSGHTIQWLTCAGTMGENCLKEAGFAHYRVLCTPRAETSAMDTREAVQRFIDAGVDLIVFCGGDGTARDVCELTRQSIPIVGIPAGVKMYSGVFGTSPARTADILLACLRDELDMTDAGVLDLDEEQYRQDQWSIRLYDIARVPIEPNFRQTAKALFVNLSDEDIKKEIATTVCESLSESPDDLIILGPGSTVGLVLEHMGLKKTLLGIDAVHRNRLVGKDLNEKALLELLSTHHNCKLVLSPIGAQGFLLGRGNAQLSSTVIRHIGVDNIIIIATPNKLEHTPTLHVDTGDVDLDRDLSKRGYLPVVCGYHQRRMVKIDI